MNPKNMATKQQKIAAEDARALGIPLSKFRGTVQHKNRWLSLIMKNYRMNKEQAKEVYDEAMGQQDGPYKFPKFSEAVLAHAGRLDGIRTLPEPGKAVKW